MPPPPFPSIPPPPRPLLSPLPLLTCESLKYAGTVTTARLTSLSAPTYAWATSFILTSTMDEISSAENCLVSFLYWTSIMGLSPGPGTTLKGQCLMSAWMVASLNLRPMRRLASKTVLMGFMAT